MTPEIHDDDDGDDVTSVDREAGGPGGTDTGSGRRQPEAEVDRQDLEGEDGDDLEDGKIPDVGDGEMPVEVSPDLDEAGPVRTLHARVRLKWSGQVVLGTAILTAIGLGLSIAVDPVEPWMVAVVVVPLLALGLAWVRLRYRLWAFQFRSDHLFLERGVYRNVETVVPYVRIQHVDTSRGPVDRVLGLSTLVVYTAGSRGADVAIPGLPSAEAEAMQDRVKELAIAAEGGEGL